MARNPHFYSFRPFLDNLFSVATLALRWVLYGLSVRLMPRLRAAEQLPGLQLYVAYRTLGDRLNSDVL